MEQTPDTGGGFAGFLAAGLWHVYRFFPSSGRWDWLLLFSLLALVVYGLFWPHLWKAIQADMRILAERRVELPNQDVVVFLWSAVSLSALLWFFHTPAGKTFLQGREWFATGTPLDVGSRLFWFSFLFHLALFFSAHYLFLKLNAFDETLTNGTPRPYTNRSLPCLFGGGGIFYRSKGNNRELHQKVSMLGMISTLSIYLHLFYWYWSRASLILMLLFTAAAALNEAVRMGFVFVQHKRTFG